MKDYTLSKEKIAELEKAHRPLRDKRQTDLLHHPGFSYKKPTH
jgi:hypothetical protein